MIVEPLEPPDPLAPFTLRSETIDVAGRRFELFVLDDDEVVANLAARTTSPVNPDAPDNPYFGVLFESALALARRVLEGPVLAGKRVLDLGCGVGLTGIAAALRDASVTFGDVMHEALALARKNAERCDVAGEFVRFDVRGDPPSDLGRFDFVIASDLLYERDKPRAVLRALDRLLAQDGVALLGDPFRPTADALAAAATEVGFDVAIDVEHVVGKDRDVDVRVFTLTRRATRA